MAFLASAAVDPDWLLSTAVQSGAALVAIIGGLLVARLAALSAERDRLLRLISAKEAERDEAAKEMNSLAAARLKTAVAKVLEEGLGRVVDAGGDVDVVDELLGSHELEDDERSASRTALLEACQKVRAAFAEIESKLPADVIPGGSLEELRNRGIVVHPGSEEIYARVAKVIGDGRRARLGVSAPVPLIDPGSQHALAQVAAVVKAVTRASPAAEVFRARVGPTREERLRTLVVALDEALGDLRAELELVGRPQGVHRSIAVLAILAGLTIILPLVMMAVHPVPGSVAVRLVVITAFVTGLGLVFWLLTSMLRDLRQTK